MMHGQRNIKLLKHEFVIFQYRGTSTGAVGKKVQKTLMKSTTYMQF